MRTVDFSPLFRSAIGFDRLFELAEAAQRVGEESYPPTTSSASTRYRPRSPAFRRTRPR
jgi:hypothetical protein